MKNNDEKKLIIPLIYSRLAYEEDFEAIRKWAEENDVELLDLANKIYENVMEEDPITERLAPLNWALGMSDSINNIEDLIDKAYN